MTRHRLTAGASGAAGGMALTVTMPPPVAGGGGGGGGGCACGPILAAFVAPGGSQLGPTAAISIAEIGPGLRITIVAGGAVPLGTYWEITGTNWEQTSGPPYLGPPLGGMMGSAALMPSDYVQLPSGMPPGIFTVTVLAICPSGERLTTQAELIIVAGGYGSGSG